MDNNASTGLQVYFDLETTGFAKTAEIIQISACFNNHKFNAYILPTNTTFLNTRISEVTNIRIDFGQMLYKNKPVNTVPLKEAMWNFIKFLKSLGDNIILVAHNGFRFDIPIILRVFEEIGLLEDFKRVVKGCADTLFIFKDIFPKAVGEKKSYKQEVLISEHLGSDKLEGAHNALVDVQMLRDLVRKVNVHPEIFKKHTRSLSSLLETYRYQNSYPINRKSLDFFRDTITDSMKSKMARAGINKNLLIRTFRITGQSGIESLLNGESRPLVTKHKLTIRKIVGFIEAMIKFQME